MKKNTEENLPSQALSVGYAVAPGKASLFMAQVWIFGGLEFGEVKTRGFQWILMDFEGILSGFYFERFSVNEGETFRGILELPALFPQLTFIEPNVWIKKQKWRVQSILGHREPPPNFRKQTKHLGNPRKPKQA